MELWLAMAVKANQSQKEPMRNRPSKQAVGVMPWHLGEHSSLTPTTYHKMSKNKNNKLKKKKQLTKNKRCP